MEDSITTTTTTETPSRQIKHIVLSGGMIYGYAFYGVLRDLHKQRLWSYDHIQSIYATSVGSIIATLIALKYDWDIMDKFVIERPWQNCFKFSLYSVMNCYQNNGIFGIETIEDTLYPLLSGKDMPMNITLEEFYQRTQIDLHFFTVKLVNFVLVDVSHTTHPHWTLVEAIYSTSCAPIFFRPFEKDSIIYTDGGALANYPTQPLFDNNPDVDEADILGIYTAVKTKKEGLNKCFGGETFTLYDYLLNLMQKVLGHVAIPQKRRPGKEIDLDCNFIPVFDLYNVVNSQEKRIKLIDYGAECAKELCDHCIDKGL
jgi:hypothetical protein